MTDYDAAKTLDELLEPGSTLMVGTDDGGPGLEFRPLTVARIDGGRIQILLDTREEWVKVFNGPAPAAVHVTVSDNRSNTWLWLRGTATTTTDAALIDELWNPFAAAYFDEGRDTPGIAVLVIDADDGRYWTTASGRVGELLSMVKAKLGRPDDAGQHGAITL